MVEPLDPESRLKRALWISFIVFIAIVVVIGMVILVLTRDRDDEQSADLEVTTPMYVEKQFNAPEAILTDVTKQSGITFTHVSGATGEHLLPETMGGGVAFFDFDNDGDQDLLFINSREWDWSDSTEPPATSRFFRNDGRGNFQVLDEIGLNSSLYGMGVAIADYDGDGYQDVFVTAVGKNRLLRNVEGTHFEDVTDSMGVAGSESSWSTCAAFFDFDNDQDLDLFVCNYVVWSRTRDLEVDYRLAGIGRAYGPPTDFAGTNPYLYRNDGNVFTNVSETSGVWVFNSDTGFPEAKALGVVAVDVNDDGFQDLIVANDTVRNFLFLNQAGVSFEESGIERGLAFDTGGMATGAMGIDIAHFDNNESIGIAIGNFANEMSSFFVRRADQTTFTDDSIVSGIGAPSRRALTFGLIFFDYDLDGRLDLFAANGHVEPKINRVQSSQNYEQPSQLWWNCGSECDRRFIYVQDDRADWSKHVVGRGVSYADIDGDGDVDLVLTQVNGDPLLLRNDSSRTNNWIRFEVRQDPPNIYALGARVVVRTDLGTQIRHLSPSKSYLSHVELPLTFGLGESDAINEVIVQWPDQSIDNWDSLEINRTHVLRKSPRHVEKTEESDTGVVEK